MLVSAKHLHFMSLRALFYHNSLFFFLVHGVKYILTLYLFKNKTLQESIDITIWMKTVTER